VSALVESVPDSDLSSAVAAAQELHKKALAVWCEGRKADAMRLLRRGIALVDSIDARGTRHEADWQRMLIRFPCSLAVVLSESGHLTAGLESLDAIRPRIAALSDESVRDELTSFVDNNYAHLLMRAGQHEESIAPYTSSIELKKRCLAAGVADPRMLIERLANSLMGRGLTFVQVGRTGEARQDLNEATVLADQYDLPLVAAYAAHNLGNLELRIGDVPTAMRRFDDCDRAYQGVGPDLIARLRLDQAQALLAAGLADEAGKHLDEVIPVLLREQINQDLGEAELFRAVAALLDDDLVLARRMATSARRRLLKRGSDAWAGIATLIGLRVDVLRALERSHVPDALPARVLKVADMLSALHLVDEAAVARMLAVRLELCRGDVAAAERLLDDLSKPGPLTPIDHRMLLRLCRAELAVAQGNSRQALAQTRAGLAELANVRDRMGAIELVSGTALHGRQLGELAVRLALRSGRARTVFDWLERTRAQTYRYEPLAGVDDPALAERIAETRHLSHALHLARLEGRATSTLEASYAAKQREAMRLGWHTSRWGKPRPVAGIDEIGKQLGDRALISFASSDDSMVAVVLVDGDVRMVRLGAASTAVENARMLHADLDALAPDELPAPVARVVAASAERRAALLDDQLLAPLAKLLRDRDVVIVPTGALYAVPWGILPALLGRPTVVAPSATAWLAAAQGADSYRAGRTVLVRGPGLEAVVGEIDKLAAHHTNATVLADEQATAGAVLQALDGAQLAHIAAHGVHEPENALFSRLELHEGSLFAHEMASLRKPPKQVVLAACELALSRIRPGDEALGFAGALLAGGVQTVIAATSRVGDQPAAAAMGDYHRALAAGASPAVALAAAVAVDPLRRPFVCLGSSHG
jgi:CHAT domain-containing protein/tetratricopeptide (TPR) repeat protein